MDLKQEIEIAEEIINVFKKYNCNVKDSITINNAVLEALLESLEYN